MTDLDLHTEGSLLQYFRQIQKFGEATRALPDDDHSKEAGLKKYKDLKDDYKKRRVMFEESRMGTSV